MLFRCASLRALAIFPPNAPRLRVLGAHSPKVGRNGAGNVWRHEGVTEAGDALFHGGKASYWRERYVARAPEASLFNRFER